MIQGSDVPRVLTVGVVDSLECSHVFRMHLLPTLPPTLPPDISWQALGNLWKSSGWMRRALMS